MGCYNVVSSIPAICPNCGARSQISVQFKFGATRQYVYSIGDILRWGASDVGVPGLARVVADGAADTPCSVCDYSGDWDFYVYIERDCIARVERADGKYDFIQAAKKYLELIDDSMGGSCQIPND